MDKNFEDFLKEAFTTDAFSTTDDVDDETSLDEEYDFLKLPLFTEQVKETGNDSDPTEPEGQTEEEMGDSANNNRLETETFRDSETTEVEGESGGESCGDDDLVNNNQQWNDDSPGLLEEDYDKDHLEKNSDAPVDFSEEGGLEEDYKEQSEGDLGAVEGAEDPASLSEEEDLEVSGNDKEDQGHFEGDLGADRLEESSDEDQGVCLDEERSPEEMEQWEQNSEDQFLKMEGGWDVNLLDSKEMGEVLNVVQGESDVVDTDKDLGVEDEHLVGDVLDVRLEEGEHLQVRSEEDLEETHQEVTQQLFANWEGTGTEDLVNYHLEDDCLQVIPEELEPGSLKDLEEIYQVNEEEEEAEEEEEEEAEEVEAEEEEAEEEEEEAEEEEAEEEEAEEEEEEGGEEEEEEEEAEEEEHETDLDAKEYVDWQQIMEAHLKDEDLMVIPEEVLEEPYQEVEVDQEEMQHRQEEEETFNAEALSKWDRTGMELSIRESESKIQEDGDESPPPGCLDLELYRNEELCLDDPAVKELNLIADELLFKGVEFSLREGSKDLLYKEPQEIPEKYIECLAKEEKRPDSGDEDREVLPRCCPKVEIQVTGCSDEETESPEFESLELTTDKEQGGDKKEIELPQKNTENSDDEDSVQTESTGGVLENFPEDPHNSTVITQGLVGPLKLQVDVQRVTQAEDNMGQKKEDLEGSGILESYQLYDEMLTRQDNAEMWSQKGPYNDKKHSVHFCLDAVIIQPETHSSDSDSESSVPDPSETQQEYFRTEKMYSEKNLELEEPEDEIEKDDLPERCSLLLQQIHVTQEALNVFSLDLKDQRKSSSKGSSPLLTFLRIFLVIPLGILLF